MRKIYLMCGVPGSGKSTFAKNYPFLKDCLIISRDQIRFPLLKDEDDYFKYEQTVEAMFYAGVNQALLNGFDVIADQSTLTIGARRKFMSHIKSPHNELNIIWVKNSLENCIENDSNREGRAYVGSRKITNMYYSFQPPTAKECSHLYCYDVEKNDFSEIF